MILNRAASFKRFLSASGTQFQGRSVSFSTPSARDYPLNRNGELPEHYLVPINKEKQTFLHEDGGYRLTGLPNNGRLFVGRDDKLYTMYECLRLGAEASSHGELLGRKNDTVPGAPQYDWITYNEAIRRSEDIAAAFLSMGIQPGQDTRIGIFSINRPEWFLVEHATYVYNMVNVPVYATFGPDECRHIIKMCKMPLILCDTQAKAKDLLEDGAELKEHLKHIVVIENFDAVLRDMGKKHGINVISFAELELLGHEQRSTRPPSTPPTGDDLATICFTSGTTGTPKGVMITHANMSAVLSMCNIIPEQIEDDCVYLSYLPAAHMFERVASTVVMLSGGRVGYYSGNTRMIIEDIKCLKPTYFITVPRVLNKIFSKVDNSVRQSPIKYAIFKLAVAYKMGLLERGKIRNNTWADRLIFNKIRVDVFGGNLRTVIVGSAPLGGEVLTFFRVALGCTVREGYGQTESTAGTVLTVAGDHKIGHVGAPCPAAEIKIVDVPDMNYEADVNGGEVLIRGPLVAKGYFMDPKLTAETFDKDGWLHTGDIGTYNDQGAIVLIDRKKHFIKLPNGEFLVTEKIETAYLRCPFVEQIYVHGDSSKSDVIAIVVPDEEYLLEFAAEQFGLKDIPVDQLFSRKQIRESVLSSLQEVGKERGLMSYEQVKRVHLVGEEFSIENDMLTPTMKNKRPEIAKRYADVINMMYSKIERDRENGPKIL